MTEEQERKPAVMIDVPSFVIGLVGIMICLGAVTLQQTHTVTAIIGLVVIISARAHLLSFPVVVRNLPKSAFASWAFVLVSYSVIMSAATARALVYLLFGS